MAEVTSDAVETMTKVTSDVVAEEDRLQKWLGMYSEGQAPWHSQRKHG